MFVTVKIHKILHTKVVHMFITGLHFKFHISAYDCLHLNTTILEGIYKISDSCDVVVLY